MSTVKGVDLSKYNWDQLASSFGGEVAPGTGGDGGNAYSSLLGTSAQKYGNQISRDGGGFKFNKWGSGPETETLFNLSDPNAPAGYNTQLYRKPDGTIGVRYYEQKDTFLQDMAKFGLAATGIYGGINGLASMAAGGAGGAAAGASSAAGGSSLGSGVSLGSSGAGLTAGGGTGVAAGSSGALGSLGSGSFAGESLAGIGSAAAPVVGAGSGGVGSILSGAGKKMGDMSLMDWINAGSTIGGIVGSNQAANAQIDASNAAIGENRRQYDLTRADQLALLSMQREDQKPWMDAGRNALGKLVNGFDITQDPSYQFRLSEGEKAVNRSAAAQGGLLSGATLKALQKYGQDMASQEYGNQYNRLASMAGVGQTATNAAGQAGQSAYGTIANAGMNSSNNIAQNLTGIGNSRAASYVGGINSLNNGISNAYNMNQGNALLSRLIGSGGGGSSGSYGGWLASNSDILNSTGSTPYEFARSF